MKRLIAVLVLFVMILGTTSCFTYKHAEKNGEVLKKAYENLNIEDEIIGHWTNIHNPSEVLSLWKDQRFELREVLWLKKEITGHGFRRPQIRTLRGGWETNGNNTLVLKNITTIGLSQDIPTAEYLEIRGRIERNKKGELRIVVLTRKKHAVIFNGEIWVKDL